MTDCLSNTAEIVRKDGTKVHLQTVKILDPTPWGENPEGQTEDYYVSNEGNEGPTLIRVAARSPFRLEQLDLGTPRGSEYWDRLQSLLKSSQ